MKMSLSSSKGEVVKRRRSNCIIETNMINLLIRIGTIERTLRFKCHRTVVGEFSFLHSSNLPLLPFIPVLFLYVPPFSCAISFLSISAVFPFLQFSFLPLFSNLLFLISLSPFSLPPFLLQFFLSLLLYLIPPYSFLFVSLCRSPFIMLSIINHWPGSRLAELI